LGQLSGISRLGRVPLVGWTGTLAGRLAGILSTFMIVATGAVVVREYRVGRERLVAEATRTLADRASLAAERLAASLEERVRLVALWAGLETAQDLAVDDVDLRLSASLADLVRTLADGSEAVGVRPDGVVLSASDPARLEGSAPPLPRPVRRALRAPNPGLHLVGGGSSTAGFVIVTQDVVSRTDGSRLGRIEVWTPLDRFIERALPLEVDQLVVRGPDGAVLFRGATAVADAGHGLSAEHTGATRAGTLTLSVTRNLAGITRELRSRARQLLTLALLFLALALPGTLLVVRSATASLAALTRAARAMDATHPQPLPPPPPWAPTEVRVLAEAIGLMIERLEHAREALSRSESLAAIGMLTKSLAHEIRTPLSVLRAGAEVLVRSPAISGREREREVSEMLQVEVERLARLVDDLLVFGRPSPPLVRETDLRDIASEALDMLARPTAEAGVTLQLTGGPVALRGDPDQLRQVALNLVSNAIRACEVGGTVTVRTSAENGMAALDVEDDGCGIEPERLEEIWQPLVTTHRSGSGLGLPIVKQLVEAHEGHVEVASTPGEGTRMCVRMPLNGPETA